MAVDPKGRAFHAAITAFEAAHREDPRVVQTPGGPTPAALQYHARVAHWVQHLDPEAPESVQLAAACQHLRRWKIPRGDYPEGRAGYHRWRTALGRMHADEAASILRDAGYDEPMVERVGDLLLKKRLRTDKDVQLLEDAVCLTFLELDYEAFAAKTEPDKVVDVVRKTWAKMSPAGHAAALQLVQAWSAQPGAPREALALIERAVAG